MAKLTFASTILFALLLTPMLAFGDVPSGDCSTVGAMDVGSVAALLTTLGAATLVLRRRESRD